jgi:hypothetical protein
MFHSYCLNHIGSIPNLEWWATPHNIKNGHWCKICGIQNMIKNRHLNSLKED